MSDETTTKKEQTKEIGGGKRAAKKTTGKKAKSKASAKVSKVEEKGTSLVTELAKDVSNVTTKRQRRVSEKAQRSKQSSRLISRKPTTHSMITSATCRCMRRPFRTSAKARS